MRAPIAIIGAGAWGTALALVLAKKGHAVRMWEYFSEYAEKLRTTRENSKFLPGITIPDSVAITNDLKEAITGCEIAVLVVPSQTMRSVVRKINSLDNTLKIMVTASKGVEKETLARMSEVISDEMDKAVQVCSLSGPSHAEEAARELPTTVVAASKDCETAKVVQDLFMTDYFRTYTSEDIVGVELGGSLKNVIALAAGVVDGLGLGDNAKAALLTRGLAEMSRLGKALGAEAGTFAGLSGMGDLIVTCTSRHSRNRRVGEEIGRGRTLKEVLDEMEMVVEGVETAKSVHLLAERSGVDMPIAGQVHRILFENTSAKLAVKELMQRPGRSENEYEE